MKRPIVSAFRVLATLCRISFAAMLAFQSSFAFAQDAAKKKNGVAYFLDEAEKRGATARNVFGGVDTKKYIIETTGTGVAIFDYDNDGWPDIFVVNGTTLEPLAGKKQPGNHLYHNNHDGRFTDVKGKRGVGEKCWWGEGGW